MAKGVPAKNGGNRTVPKNRMGTGGGLPTKFTDTYGNNVAGTNKGGGSVPARNGGNRRDPKNKMGLASALPTNFDSSTKIK